MILRHTSYDIQVELLSNKKLIGIRGRETYIKTRIYTVYNEIGVSMLFEQSRGGNFFIIMGYKYIAFGRC